MHLLFQILQSIDLVALAPRALRYLRSVPSALKRDPYHSANCQTVGMIGETRRHLSSEEANTSETVPTLEMNDGTQALFCIVFAHSTSPEKEGKILIYPPIHGSHHVAERG